MTCRLAVLVMIALVSVLPISGCAKGSPAVSTALAGAWYDSRTGTQYQFIGDHTLVLQRPQPDGSNAVTFSLPDDKTLDVTARGVHRVSTIATLTADALVLIDPVSGTPQNLFRDARRTTYAARLARGAVEHAAGFAGLTAATDITWTAARPAGDAAAWGDWSPSTLDAYAQEWDWVHVKPARVPIAIAGGGDAMAYSFTLKRRVAVAPPADAGDTKTVRGSTFIDVGYSVSKQEYPAGTLVYLRSGLLYSLGDGYAVAVRPDIANEAFIPITHD